jgi:uncharacterized membrane protein
MVDVGPAPVLSADSRPTGRPPVSRMAIAVLAVVGALVSAYLALYKLGYMGVIQCAGGGCAVVQASEYSVFFGVPVALWGVGAYLFLLAVSLIGLQPRWVEARWVAYTLFGFAAWGVVFSGYLTYLSGSVIGAFCQWCLVSAGLISAIFLLTLPALRTAR